MTLDSATISRIRDAVDEGFDDQVALTAELVRIPSLMGAERPAQELMARAFADAGLAVDRWAIDVESLRRAGVTLAGDLFVESVIEEEATGNGTLACVQRGYRADFGLITEPTSTTYVEAQVGLLWFEVTVAGNPRHPSLARTGRASAIDKALVLAQALQGLEDRWNAEKSKHPLFDEIDRPIVIDVGRIEGGDWTSSVPGGRRSAHERRRSPTSATRRPAASSTREPAFRPTCPPRCGWKAICAAVTAARSTRHSCCCARGCDRRGAPWGTLQGAEATRSRGAHDSIAAGSSVAPASPDGRRRQ